MAPPWARCCCSGRGPRALRRSCSSAAGRSAPSTRTWVARRGSSPPPAVWRESRATASPPRGSTRRARSCRRPWRAGRAAHPVHGEVVNQPLMSPDGTKYLWWYPGPDGFGGLNAVWVRRLTVGQASTEGVGFCSYCVISHGWLGGTAIGALPSDTSRGVPSRVCSMATPAEAPERERDLRAGPGLRRPWRARLPQRQRRRHRGRGGAHARREHGHQRPDRPLLARERRGDRRRDGRHDGHDPDVLARG